MAGRLFPKVTRSAFFLAARGHVRQDHHAAAVPAALRDEIYPKVGNREVVGFGFNGLPSYVDQAQYPCPSVRFREDSKEIRSLHEKEKGDWHKLTLEEKKALYRASFCQTFAEVNAPTGEWKSVVAGILFAMSFTAWVLLAIKEFALPPMPHTITREWQEKQLELMVKQRQGPYSGVASQWDYENKRWK